MIKIVPSFLQSDSWKKLQNSIGKKTFEIETKNSKTLVIQNEIPFGFNYLYIPHGPGMSIFSGEEISEFLVKLKDLAKKQKSIFVKIDPRIIRDESMQKKLKSLGFKRSQEMQPEKTIALDVTKNTDDILNKMESETRYAIRTAEKRSVKVEIFSSVDDKKKHFDEFWIMFQKTMERSELKSHPKKYFENLLLFSDEPRTDLYIASVEDGNIISSAIFLKYKSDYIYLYAASEKGFGRYNAPSFLIWNAILQAKKEGSEFFDFWGISYIKKKWSGITKFKKSFGGDEITYVGAWDLPIRKFIYLLFLFYKRFF